MNQVSQVSLPANSNPASLSELVKRFFQLGRDSFARKQIFLINSK